jgi:peptidoglycan hydrolase CwlO-like protein
MRQDVSDSRSGVRRGTALATALVATLSLVIVVGAGEAPAQLDRIEARQGDLQAEIDQANRQIDSLIAEEAALREQEAEVADELAAKQAELDETTQELREAEAYLVAVRARLGDAKVALSKMLVQIYKSNPPDAVDFVLSSQTFGDAIAQAEYLEAIDAHQEAVITRVTDLRAEVTVTVEQLADARARIESARDEIAAHRDELAAAGADLESQHATLAAAKAERRQALTQLVDRERRLEREAAQSEPAPESDGGGSVPAPNGATATLADDGSAVAPAGAPAAVQGAIAAANEIKDAPYAWGGGHGSFESSGYDCSGAVSYALHGGGLLSAPLDSGGLMSYGDAGPGEWITVYANPGHAFVVIAGLRWDTSGDSQGTGPSWYTDTRSTAGYVARHPPGL